MTSTAAVNPTDPVIGKRKRKPPTPRTPPTEVDYYSKMLNSIRGKKYETYAVSRILHLLADPEIELVTQQPIRLNGGELRLLDLYLPQFMLGLEVDEPHHDIDEESVEYDRIREQAIIDISDLEMKRVKVQATDSLGTLTQQIDELIDDIRARKHAAIDAGTFRPFIYGRSFDPAHWVGVGTLTTRDDVQMQKTTAVCALFGKTVSVWRRGILPLTDGLAVWMPGLNQEGVKPRDDWENNLSADEETIVETQLLPGEYEYGVGHRRFVFGKFKDPVFIDRYYRFLGEFEVVDIEEIESTGRKRVRYSRVSDSVDLTAHQLS